MRTESHEREGEKALCLMTIHAHPDDEASKGAPTVARYHDQGAKTVLVCCTGGEAGSILNPAMDSDENRKRLSEIRMGELEQSRRIIGYDAVELLGYRDSGMKGAEENNDPRSFARADGGEAMEKLFALFDRYRPQVVIAYDDESDWYPHPDHQRVHELTTKAFRRAAELGKVFAPKKLYYSVFSRGRIEASHQAFLDRGLKSPFDERFLNRRARDGDITTRIPVNGYGQVRLDALRAHRTQIDPESPFWFGLGDEVASELYPFDEYILAAVNENGAVHSWPFRGPGPLKSQLVPQQLPEADLFSGIG